MTDTILGALLGALLASLAAYFSANIAAYSKDIVEERRKWRDKIRELTEETIALTKNAPLTSRDLMRLKTAF